MGNCLIVNTVGILIVFDKLLFAFFDRPSDFDVLEGEENGLILVLGLFSGDIVKNFMRNGFSLCQVMRGEFFNHGHHQILVALIEQCSFCCLALLVQFLDDHANAVKIYEVVVEFTMQHFRSTVISTLDAFFLEKFLQRKT